MPMPWEKDYGDEQKPASAMPWEKDYSEGGKESDFLHPQKPAAGSGWRGVLERITQYPRIFLGDVLDAGETLGKVSRGELDAAHPDAIKAASTIAGVGGPAGEFAGAGGQIARRAGLGKVANPGDVNPAFVAPSAGMQAAQTAVDVGSPLPAGIVSETPGTKAFTQGFRQVPFVGPGISHKVGETIKAAGGRVGDISEELSGGPVADRATVGANTRQSLQDVIESNNSAIDQAYNDLRTNHIDPNGASGLPNTKATLDAIKRERQAAGMTNPSAGISDIENLASADRSFNGLVRARSDVGQMVRASKDNPNPGFVPGDFKRVYGAMTRDLENVVRSNPLPGVNPDDAVDAFRFANGQAQHLIERNGNIQRLIGGKSDESLTGSLINSAKDKGGNLRLLGELRTQMPPEDFEKISGILLHELGHTPEGFSLAQFAGKKGWGSLTDATKSILIADPAHRKALDDIAGLGNFLKVAERDYHNTSKTAHAAGVTGALVELTHLIREPHEIGSVLAGLASGYGLSKILGRPASASALRKWLTIAKDKATGRYGPARGSAALALATRNLQNNLPEPAQAEPARREPLRVTVHPKSQSRAPSSDAYPPPLRP